MKFDWSLFGIVQGSSIDTDTIAQTQKLLSVVFPDLYLDLVKYADEASPEISSFPYGNAGTCISEFFSFSPVLKAGTIVWHTRVAGLPTGWVAIARDAGDYLICLNFNTRSTTVEMFDPESGSTGFVANSFNDFVGLWRE
ncbi:SMI1/KNR4 family protein [Pseudomonas frederiksbergensis]|uniref:SMI1/KNR4 family protein n=1 Tax=Pseudomonas frederiksbergensis TaxID=104087 RepID=UPI003D1C61D2